MWFWFVGLNYSVLVCVVLVACICGNCLSGASFCVDGLCYKCLCGTGWHGAGSVACNMFNFNII